MKKINFSVLLLFLFIKIAYSQDFAYNLESKYINSSSFRTALYSPPIIGGRHKSFNTSNTYIHEVNAKDGRWKLIGTSIELCAFTYGPLLAPAFGDLQHQTKSSFLGFYIPAVIASGAIPFFLTMDKPIKRGPPVAFGGMGVLGFMDGLWIYTLIGYKSIINIKGTDDALAAAQNGLRTMVVTTVGGAVGGYFLAKRLELGPGEVSMMTSNGRWMFLEGVMLLGAYATKDQIPNTLDFGTGLFIAGGDSNSVSTFGGVDRAHFAKEITPKQMQRGHHVLTLIKVLPATLAGASILGCGLGYLATRNQSFTQGDIRIYNNMIFLSELATAATLSLAGLYGNELKLDKALAMQALAYPIGAALNLIIFKHYDYSNTESKAIGTITQIFTLTGGGIGYLIAKNGKTVVEGAAIGGCASFLLFTIGLRKFAGNANFSLLKGTSDMGFTLLQHDKGSLAPGLRLTYDFR